MNGDNTKNSPLSKGTKKLNIKKREFCLRPTILFEIVLREYYRDDDLNAIIYYFARDESNQLASYRNSKIAVNPLGIRRISCRIIFGTKDIGN